MPFIVYEGPALRSPEARVRLVEGITRTVAEVLEIDPGDVVLLIKEQGGPHMTRTPQAIAVGGKLLAPTRGEGPRAKG